MRPSIEIKTIADVSKRVQNHAFHVIHHDQCKLRPSERESLEPGMKWARKLLSCYTREYDRPPEAYAKAIFTLVRAINAELPEKPKFKEEAERFMSRRNGALHILDWLTEEQRKAQAEWEKENPELIEKGTT